MKNFPDALWLWSRSAQRDERDRRLQFRRTFDLATAPATAEICVTADSYYTLWCNGQYVNRGPARGFQDHWPFDRIELAPYLRAGKNVLAVLVYQYGISNYSYTHEWSSGFLLVGRAGNVSLATGPEWKFREAPGYLRAVARCSGQYCFQEFFDCRAADGNWQSEAYDDAAWEFFPLHAGRAVGCMPWPEFEERQIPLLTHEILRPRRCLAQSCHSPAPGWSQICNIGNSYLAEQPAWEPVADPAPEIHFTPGVTAKLLDFGQEVVGHLIFDVEAAAAGEILDFMVSESCTGLTPDFPVGSTDNAILFGGRLILDKGRNQHELTLPWGLRYVVLLHRGSGNLQVATAVRQTRYPLQEIGKFVSSNARLNRIWQISRHTQKCCMVDAYIDCPWRENAQWWGDALVQSQNTFRLSADTRLFERGLRQIATQKTPNGLTYAIAPSCGHSCILPDYSAMWIVTLYAHYFQTGRPTMWLELRDTADGILNYFQEQAQATGLVTYDPRYWLFLDWSPQLFKQGTPTLLNLLYLWALQSAWRLATATQDAPRSKRYETAIQNLQSAISRQLFDAKRNVFYDGLTQDGTPVASFSPHVAALGILLGLFPEAHETWLADVLLPLVKGHRTEALLPSSYFMYYIFEALKLKNHRREVIDCISNWWGEFIDAGLTTTPENWLERLKRGSGSMCHAWSAHPLVHFSEILLGVRATSPGWASIEFDPVMTPGEKLSGVVPTPRGNIEVSWDWSGSKPRKNIQVPPGIKLITPPSSTRRS